MKNIYLIFNSLSLLINRASHFPVVFACSPEFCKVSILGKIPHEC